MKRIALVVDDNGDMRQAVTDLLLNSKYEVIQAINGEEALQKIRSLERIDLLVTDFNMPKIDGAQLIRTVADERLAVSEIIFMSADSIIHGMGSVLKMKLGGRTKFSTFDKDGSLFTALRKI